MKTDYKDCKNCDNRLSIDKFNKKKSSCRICYNSIKKKCATCRIFKEVGQAVANCKDCIEWKEEQKKNPMRQCQICNKIKKNKAKNFPQNRKICRPCGNTDRNERRNTLEGRIGTLLSNCGNHAKKMAKRNPILGIVTITKKDLYNLYIKQHGRCFYSNTIMSTLTHSNNQMSLERLNNNKGYIKENVVLICLEYNTAAQWSKRKFYKVPYLHLKSDDPNFEKMLEIAMKSYVRMGPKTKKPECKSGTAYCYACEEIKLITEFYDTKSKGCKQCISEYNKNYGTYIRGWLTKLISNANKHTKKRNESGNWDDILICDITIEDLLDLLRKQKGKCAISNIQLQYGAHKNWRCSLERIDVRQGYTKDNICLICAEFNSTDNTIKTKPENSNGGTGWNKDKFNQLLLNLYTNHSENVMKYYNYYLTQDLKKNSEIEN